MSNEVLHRQLPYTLQETGFPSLGLRYQGKVRDTYLQNDRLILITTDRLSAFDRVLTSIPFKGEILNRLAHFWFEKTSHIARNHVLDMPDPNVTVAQACEPFAVELVVRGYLTGSLWRDVQNRTASRYGLQLPENMRKNERFPAPIVTPSTKAALGAHDEPISEADILSRRLMTPREWAQASEMALGLFQAGQEWAASRGLILVDTKYEFGKRGDELILIDEIHTPDSSRYWMADSYFERFQRGEEPLMLDKENIRQWLIQERKFQGDGPLPEIPDTVRVELASKYVEAFEKITGKNLPLVVGSVAPRVTRNLAEKGYL